LRILAFAGSLRVGSYNKKLLAIAVERLRERGADVDVLDLREVSMPDYDGDIEATSGLPGGARVMRERIAQANAVLVAAPEYNASIPGMLKNVIDWTSRPPNQPWSRKVVTLLAATTGPGGGRAVLVDMRKVLSALGAFVLPAVVSLPRAGDALDEHGQPADAASPTWKQLDAALAMLLDVGDKLG
jgi:chromate reductase, NAD(P)H dehydrogenase (quinone)